MFKITILSVGSLKEDYWKQAEAEYQKRLSAWVDLSIKEIKEIPFTAKDSVENIIEQEAVLIKNHIPKNSIVVLLDISGKEMDSVSFSQKLEQHMDIGTPVTFIIGGPLGTSDQIRAMADIRWSLSPLTYTHQIARILVHEQLYRALSIIKGKTYHY